MTPEDKHEADVAFSCDTLISQGLILQLFFNTRLCIVRKYRCVLEAVAVTGGSAEVQKRAAGAGREARPEC